VFVQKKRKDQRWSLIFVLTLAISHKNTTNNGTTQHPMHQANAQDYELRFVSLHCHISCAQAPVGLMIDDLHYCTRTAQQLRIFLIHSFCFLSTLYLLNQATIARSFA
jgi:hypothetical protein